MIFIYAAIVLALALVWSLWGYFSSRVENTAYTVVESKGKYEIRVYPEHLVAETVVKGPYREALNQGFRIVAGYIFGGNVEKSRVAMTAPVVERTGQTEEGKRPGVSEPIAMTAPVTSSVDGESHTISFGMPRSYTKETLPTPTDARVRIVKIPEKKMAAIRFSWSRSEGRIQSKRRELIDALNKDAVTMVGAPQYAGYNAPWTPPWMLRNEVMVEVK